MKKTLVKSRSKRFGAIVTVSSLLTVNFLSPMAALAQGLPYIHMEEGDFIHNPEDIVLPDSEMLDDLSSEEEKTEKGIEKSENTSLIFSELALANSINALPPGASVVYDLQVRASGRPFSPIVISEGKDIKIISTTNSTILTGFRVEEGSSLTFGDGLTYQGNTDPANRVGVTIDGNNAEFILDGGRITNIRSDRPAAVNVLDGHFRMIDGLIDNNSTRGVSVLNGNFTMTGGSIENNTINNGNGGGVSVSENGSVMITGGSIRDNTASNGGGVFVESLTTSNLKINNEVEFSGNSAISTQRPPLNVESVFPNIQTRSSSVAAFSHPLNNTDIGFNSISPAIKTLSILKNLDGGGNINVADEINVSTREIFQGTSTNIQAAPSPGYRFVRWEVNGAGSTVTNSIDADTVVNIGSEDATLTAVFERIHTLTLQASPAIGGTPTIETSTGGSTGTVAEGSITTLYANPAPGYEFMGWESSNGGVFEDANSPITSFSMPNNNTVVTANFKLQELTFLDFFPDLNLAQALANHFNRQVTDEVTEEELNHFTGAIIATNRNISNLEGIQHLTGVTTLYLTRNKLDNESLEPLSQLSNLRMLFLGENQITDLSVFSDSMHPNLTISARDQKITLDPINVGEITEGVFIRTRFGEAPSNLSFNPIGGSYKIENGMITWAGVGENTLIWSGEHNFSGTITQVVNPS